MLTIQSTALRRSLGTLLLMAFAVCPELVGQTAPVQAQVASIAGSVLVSGNSRGLRSLAHGDALSPGDEIDTRGGGRLTISLSDGSLIVIQPDSRVLLKDFGSASTLRELFDIFLGRIRVKINHYAGRPNPYRINSPTASIAVRGTEFSVAVDMPGNTQVFVFEGLVEVTSLSEPDQRILVEPGRGVIVRPNQPIRYFTPVPGREVADRDLKERNGSNQENGRNISGEHDDETPRNTAGTYQRLIASLVESGQTPYLMRFTAFPDSHLDSLQNPSYATEFRALEGRMFIIPSIRGSGPADATSSAFAPSRPIDYNVAPQFSFFTPLPGGRSVIGGAVASSRSASQSFSFDEGIGAATTLLLPNTAGARSTADSTHSTFLSGSLIFAHQLGATGRTSIGFGLDQVSGSGSLLHLATETAASPLLSSERIQSNSSVGQTQFKVGISRDFGAGQKLGVYYRYGRLSASDRDRSRLVDNLPQSPDSSMTSGHVQGLGLRLRGSLTRRLFYGAEVSLLGVQFRDRLRRAASVDSHQQDKLTRAAIGLGLGYAIRPRVLMSFDLSAGIDHISNYRTEDATGNPLESNRQTARFVSAGVAIQADVWRHMFISGSFMTILQSVRSSLVLYPDRFGGILSDSGLYSPQGFFSNGNLNYYSETGVGWRFSPHWLVQYVISTDYGPTPPSHTILFRYTFHAREK